MRIAPSTVTMETMRRSFRTVRSKHSERKPPNWNDEFYPESS
jgi:hypothetical protein